ncbi:hypothetical protein AN958_03976 [Leucoagaricus sp. SymC.cos]|nr:hypothetical protein AN958_03976 [Leucoagaricus sp. SymC.cos]
MSSPDDPSTLAATHYTTPAPPKRKSRRSSYEVLHGIAGPDSNLPLPRRLDDPTTDSTSSVNGPTDVIREGIPMSFGSPPTSTQSKRPSSPTRSLSRIPVAAVGNARALADDGHHHHLSSPVRTTLTGGGDTLFTSSLAPPSPTPNGVSSSSSATAPSSLLLTPSHSSVNLNSPSPAPQTRRVSVTPGGTTKVLADLQAGVINARNALENTKSQLRLSQRTVASLTRKVEDLKEVEERLRIENEGLNNVVARKERLLQEVLERARKAEAEAASLKQQLKHETSTSKKTIREMETQLSESTALSKKSEREYITLRDSLKQMSESWKHDTEALKSEMRKREEKWRKEVDGIGKKYKDLCGSVKEREKIWEEEWKKAREEDKKKVESVEKIWMTEVERMQEIVEKSGRDCEKAERTAQDLALELSILRKRMQSVRPLTTDDQQQTDSDTTTTNSSSATAVTSNTITPPVASSTTIPKDDVPP